MFNVFVLNFNDYMIVFLFFLLLLFFFFFCLRTHAHTDCSFSDTIREINDTFELACSCGYVTLIDASSTKYSKSRNTDALNGGAEDISNDMDLETTTADNLLSLECSNESELVAITDDNIIDSDSIRNINSGDKLVCRGTITPSNAVEASTLSESWTPLQLCYGIPLFDEEVNADVTRKVRPHKRPSLIKSLPLSLKF